MNNPAKPGLFYGWFIVPVAAIGLFMGYVPIIGFSFSVFFRPISEEFSWSRGQVALGFSLSLLVLSAALPVVGRLVDRYGARTIILPAALLFGLGLTSFYFLSNSIWHFYGIYIFLGIVGSGTAAVPYYKVISQWFDRRRGLALGLTMGGAGVGFFVMPTLSFALISTFGWRLAYVLIGVTVIVVTIPVVGLFLKERPQLMGLLPDGDQAPSKESGAVARAAPGLTAREAWRSPTFWVLCTALFIVSLSLNGCLIHIVPLLMDRGISAQSAALAASVLGGATLAGRIATGYLLDRFFATYVAVCFFSLAAVGVLMLWAGAANPFAFIAALLIGVGIGAEGDIMAYLVGRYFGLIAFGEIYAYVLAIYTLGAVVGPLLMGVGFDSTGSYDVVLGPFLVVTLVGAFLMTRLGPYRTWQPVAEPATK
ncbi:MAG TPA: MFS transporter [Pyrinomonadaceae bacterium]|nr:MFS transporter [Pyrinomonadaceae bacterium]